ncbi:LemA family protein [Elusimicrobium minutum Pei191]|uniref:LemA family protein n=1 Tax=Elusimicrobium minutum (strain Pei191) TaxID=445932 RepID=B2KBB3_ELUMP|nr:LemA family protein [Elusimicrobium minutum]ACC97935.1 LemA family protein [Elusimicrobium minutum Pei191]
MTISMVLLAVVLAAVIYLATAYNGFITLRNRVKEAWSDIEVQMKRRYDLIPNLVETVKGYASHERETLEKVVEARNMAMSGPKDMESVAKNENILSGTLKSLFALSESYPDLKANQNFLQLQSELRDTEDKIQAARRFYNSNVLSLNTKVEHFPSNIIAGIFHFNKEKFFELEEEAARQPVQVKF